MSTLDPATLAALLDGPATDEDLLPSDYDSTLESPSLIPTIELDEGELDPRLKLLSHSSRTTLHKCPRKYQLYRLSSREITLQKEVADNQSVTFAYGHAVGVGMQATLEGKSSDRVLLETFLAWSTDLLLDNPKQHKSFWLAVWAVNKFLTVRESGVLKDYDLVYWEGKPAIELGFQIMLPNNYVYRGFLDAALQHRYDGTVMVLESKTSSSIANPATFKNSGQALGYSVVLDKLFPALSSYKVLYLVYETKSLEYKALEFTKSLLQRALWLQELLIDTQIIDLYASYDTFPTHGESCFDFFRECEYLGMCHMETANLTKPLTQLVLDKIAEDSSSYTFTIPFEDLVAGQIDKAAIESNEGYSTYL